MIRVRLARLPEDAPGIGAIDRSFETRQVFEVAASDEGIALGLRDLDAPLWKDFPLSDLADPDRPYTDAWVAQAGGRIVGFAATQFQAWNGRLTLWHFYVDPSVRRQGVARSLLEAVKAQGRACGARHVWLEASSLNTPGYRAYLALGFRLTGADLTLYDGTPAQGEAALFLSCPLSA